MRSKMVKIALLTGLTCISTAVFSGAMGPEKTATHLGAYYIGASLGISDLQDTTSHEVTPETHHLSGLGILGGGFVGYNFNFTPKIYAGLEGFANATGLNSSIKHYDQATGIQDHSENIRSRYNLGLRLIPGFQFTPENEGHLIIGYSNASFKHSDNGTYGYLDTTFNQNGFQTGAGWKTQFFNPNMLVRLDVLYTVYSGQLSTGLGLPGSDSALQFYRDEFNTLEADLSLIYQFDRI